MSASSDDDDAGGPAGGNSSYVAFGTPVEVPDKASDCVYLS